MKVQTFVAVFISLVVATGAKIKHNDSVKPLSSKTEFKSKYIDDDEDNGGPSSEFQPMGYDWSVEYLTHRKQKDECLKRKRSFVSAGVTPEELCAKEKEFFAKLPKEMEKLEIKLNETLEKAGIQGVVTGRIKSLQSLINKMNANKITDVRQITDIVALRVTLQTISDITAFKQTFLSRHNGEVTEIRCYGTCGPDIGIRDEREKRYWPMRKSGYRRLHFKVKISNLETEAEIQVGTPYMTLWAEWEHAVIYKGPEHIKYDKKVLSYAQELAGYYMMLDNIRDGMNIVCPNALRFTYGQDIFTDDEWKIFGKPKDGCNFWNDLRVDMP